MPTLKSMVLCQDAKRMAILKRALNRLEIGIDIPSGLDGALDTLRTDKFEALIVDFELPGATGVMQQISSLAGKKTILMAILSGDDKVRDAFNMGANFVLFTPVTMERATQSLRAAKTLMYPSLRRHIRQRMHTQASISFDKVHNAQAVILDLGEGGMAVQMSEPVTASQVIHVRFDLPGGRKSVEAKGEVAWADVRGRVGIRFLQVAKPCQKVLNDWLISPHRIAG
jgi:DNA-binding NarL/FixJ family response regulator